MCSSDLSVLAQKDDAQRLAVTQEPTDLARVHYVRQGEALGLGHAVLVAEQHVGDRPFAVLLGDDLIDDRDPVLPKMIDVREKFGGSVLCLMRVPRNDISMYGCAGGTPTEDPDVWTLDQLIEKPTVEEAPSDLAIIGRYVLDPVVFDVLKSTKPGRGGEIQLTDALRELVSMPPDQGGGVRGVIFEGRRYDTGDKLSYLKAVISLATERDDIGEELRAWIADQGFHR